MPPTNTVALIIIVGFFFHPFIILDTIFDSFFISSLIFNCCAFLICFFSNLHLENYG